MLIKFTAAVSPSPGKLAEAELHFEDGPLEGLSLIGFAIWERRDGTGRTVDLSRALLRPITDAQAADRLRELILAAFATDEQTRVD